MGIIDQFLAKQLYLDTSIFIYSIEQYPDFQELSDAIINAATQYEIFAVTSELALSEALVMPIRKNNTALQELFEEAIQSAGGLLVVPIERQILVRAAELRALQPNLKTPDAIHLATALETGCEVFLTNDSRIKNPDLEIVTLSSLVVPQS